MLVKTFWQKHKYKFLIILGTVLISTTILLIVFELFFKTDKPLTMVPSTIDSSSDVTISSTLDAKPSVYDNNPKIFHLYYDTFENYKKSFLLFDNNVTDNELHELFEYEKGNSKFITAPCFNITFNNQTLSYDIKDPPPHLINVYIACHESIKTSQDVEKIRWGFKDNLMWDIIYSVDTSKIQHILCYWRENVNMTNN